jgi:hypothetical protein
MNPIEIGCRVVCTDAHFPEIAYHDCQALPRPEGVYTVTAVDVCPRVLNRVLVPSLQLAEFQQPRRGKSGVPWFVASRFRRLDDTVAPDLLIAEPAHV